MPLPPNRWTGPHGPKGSPYFTPFTSPHLCHQTCPVLFDGVLSSQLAVHLATELSYAPGLVCVFKGASGTIMQRHPEVGSAGGREPRGQAGFWGCADHHTGRDRA